MNHQKHTAAVSRTVWLRQLTLITLLVTGCGGDGSGNTDVDQPPPTPGISLLAGSIGGPGNLDGVGLRARFVAPSAVAVDRSGNVYAVDNFTIRKVSASGVVTTLAGSSGVSGMADGVGAAARFQQAHDITVDATGNVYVIDGCHRAVRKVTATGVVTTLIDVPPYAHAVNSIAVDLAGSLFANVDGSARKITSAGVVTTIGGAGFGSGYYLAVDASGNVYAGAGSGAIQKLSPDGVVVTLPVDGVRWLANDTAGNVYVYVQNAEGAVARKIDSTGTTIKLPTSIPWSTIGNLCQENPFSRFSVGETGEAFVADYVGRSIGKIAPNGTVTPLAGLDVVRGFADGAGASATFGVTDGYYAEGINFNDVAVDSTGNVYVADSDNATIRKISLAGVVTTVAGAAGQRGAVDGLGAAARFDKLRGVALDSAGNLYVTDSDTLRRVTPAGVVTTVAGTAYQFGSSDGVGATAKLGYPGGVAVDAAGNAYVAQGIGLAFCCLGPPDYVNAYAHTIRKITPAGMVTTLAGSAGNAGSTDGPGAAARFNFDALAGMAVDASGNVYVADSANHTIRKITPAGVVTTLAGTAGASGSSDGVGAAARFTYPRRVTIDTTGNLYVTSGNAEVERRDIFMRPGVSIFGSTIRKITPAGVVTTIAGQAGSEGIALGALPGSLAYLGGITVDTKGALYAASQAAVLKIQLPQ